MKTYNGDVKITAGNQQEWEKTLLGVKKILGYVIAEQGASITLPVDVKKYGEPDYDLSLSINLKSELKSEFSAEGYLWADGIITELLSKRRSGKILFYKTKTLGMGKVIYVAQKGDMFSHGETPKQAAHDLRYKLNGNRDTSEYKKWTLDTVKPVAEIIQSYRIITGACEIGTRQWCEGKKLPAKVSIKVAIRLTREAYAGAKFAAFFRETK